MNPLLLLKIIKSKYTWWFLFALASAWMFNSYTSGKVEKAVAAVYSTIELQVINLIKDDDNAVKQQDNILNNSSIIDGMYPEQNSDKSRQEYNQGDSNKIPNAYPYIENGFEANSRDGTTVELPYFGVPEQSSKDTASPKILQCTETEVILCINGCCKEL